MTILPNLLAQTITYWAPTGARDGYGHYNAWARSTLVGRWEDRIETITTRTSDEYHSESRIFLQSSVVVGGWLYLGSSSASDPKTVDGAREIVKSQQLPSVDATETLYKAWL